MTVYERNRKLVITFLLPALFLYLLFFIYPAIRGFYYSTLEWSGFTQAAEFRGLGNFFELSSFFLQKGLYMFNMISDLVRLG